MDKSVVDVVLDSELDAGFKLNLASFNLPKPALQEILALADRQLLKNQVTENRAWLDGLRDYQIYSRRLIMDAWATKHRILFQLCTGAGKSVIIRSILLNLWAKDKKVLVLCEDSRILEQLHHHAIKSGIPPEENGIIKAFKSGEYPLELYKPVQVGMAQTLASSWEIIAPNFTPDVIIVDEGHHCDGRSRYYQLWKQYPNARILAVTATPARPAGFA